MLESWPLRIKHQPWHGHKLHESDASCGLVHLAYLFKRKQPLQRIASTGSCKPTRLWCPWLARVYCKFHAALKKVGHGFWSKGSIRFAPIPLTHVCGVKLGNIMLLPQNRWLYSCKKSDVPSRRLVNAAQKSFSQLFEVERLMKENWW